MTQAASRGPSRVSSRGSQTNQAKTCATCGRSMQWRRKWADCWAEIRYCSDTCRAHRPGDLDSAAERCIVELLRARPRNASICPSEAARSLGGDQWRELMGPVRAAARRLAANRVVEITQGGHRIDPSRARGPIRLRLSSGS
jgi:hypothetical protein